jgi:hypothetical protein
MPLESKKYSSIYIQRDEQYVGVGINMRQLVFCFVSQQSYATTEEAVLAMQEYDAE